jgi:hypothetical protein
MRSFLFGFCATLLLLFAARSLAGGGESTCLPGTMCCTGGAAVCIKASCATTGTPNVLCLCCIVQSTYVRVACPLTSGKCGPLCTSYP